MCEENECDATAPGMSRRAFAAGAAALASFAATTARAAAAVTERAVDVKTPDGTADAVLYHPQGSGSWPTVLVWTDNQGLRPVFRDLGKRLAAEGYTVLVPNPFYRSRRAPQPGDGFDFTDPAQRSTITALSQTLTPEGTTRDGIAFIDYLDSLPQTNKARKAGVQGYCMGGPLTFRTAAALPDRIGAAHSFHGGGLATANANSPHLLIPRMKAEVRVAIAQNDDERDPAAKTTLKTALDTARLANDVRVYPAAHGWCVPGGASYNQVEAEKAWADLLDLYKRRLV